MYQEMICLITDRDNMIIKEWFEPYKFATIGQIQKAYFRDQQYSYEIARKRLLEMCKAGFIKPYHDVATNRNVYILKNDKIKPPSYHRIIILDILAEMKYCGFNVEYFKVEMPWLEGKIISDAFAIFTIKKRRYHFFIETQLSKHGHYLEKYDVLKESGEVQRFLGKNHFPRILFISDIEYSDIKIKSTEVIRLDTKLNQFPSILL
jgi:hypothetical protein